MMKSEVVGQPSVVSNDLVQSVGPKICERRHFTISEIYEFPQISRTLLCDILTVRPCCDRICARWVPKMLMDAHRMQNALTFLE
jgi:hypothetical protein